MKRFCTFAPILAVGLSGCSTATVPSLGLSDMGFPRLQMLSYEIEDTTVPTLAYSLSAAEAQAIRQQFSSQFQGGRTLEFGPISARQRLADQALVVCGLVNVREPDGRSSGMRLFDGTASAGLAGEPLSFKPQRISGANARAIDVYSRCRDAGLLGARPDEPAVAAASVPMPQSQRTVAVMPAPSIPAVSPGPLPENRSAPAATSLPVPVPSDTMQAGSQKSS